MKRISRRHFVETVAASTGAAAAGLSSSNTVFAWPRPSSKEFVYPRGFQWGCATAAYQIEGGATEGGRGSSIWDVFSHTPGKTHNGDTGDVAADSYHLYKEDIRLMKDLGLQVYRMSISWPRIFPLGTGKANSAGVDYYSRLVDELLANNITPYITLFHWDLPAALPGGWQNRDTSKALADYAAYITGKLGDRVKHWMTTNEFLCFSDLSYRFGELAPGLRLPPGECNQVRHHAILAHGLAVGAIRANTPKGSLVGLAENANVFCPVIETPEHITAAQKATRIRNGQFLSTVMEGNYPEEYLKQEGENAPKIEPGDMEAIGSKLDFLGLNIYSPGYVRADASPAGFAIEPIPKSYPRMFSPWEALGPECMYWGVRNVCDLWKVPAIYITENGTASDDKLTAEGRVEDVDRVMYLRNHLTHLHRAVAEGYPVKGYFLWSLMDNFEWADGYSKRFGLHYVDFQTQKRTPKLSAQWYRNVVAQSRVL